MPSSTTPSVWKLLGLDLQNEEHMPMSEHQAFEQALDFINDIANVITEMQNQLVTNLASYKI